ncbi:hypothetical protein OF83DRAFT_1146049 [Amylostereum chailletii]|nr:hypothetical protein OF83DRAFT_1146049 [Amylostereum chailletii]
MARYRANHLTYWTSVREFRSKTDQARHELDMALLDYSMISRRRIAADEVYEKAKAGALCEDLDLSDPEP